MGKLIGKAVMVGFFVLTLVGSASAVEVCLGLSNFGNIFKVEATQHGNFFQLSGSERVFADRAVSGTAFVGANNTIRVGFLHIANNGQGATDIIWNAQLSAGTLSGPYTARRISFNDEISGTMSAISCSGVAGEGGPDAGAK